MVNFFPQKFVQYLFLESFFVSLDKSVLLHCRCLMSKFSEMLILVCRKIFSAFYPILHETISNSYSFPHMPEFNPVYPHLVLYDRKHFCDLDWFEQRFIFVSSEVPFAKLLSEECSYKTVSKNAEAAIRICSSEAVAQRSSIKKLFLEISQNSQENTHPKVSLLLKLQETASAGNFIKKETLAQEFSCEFCEISKNTFSCRTPLVAASSSSK